MTFELDMVHTIALSVVLLLLGDFLVKKINFLSKYCIPAPVVGGLIFSILALILRETATINFEMDTTLQTLTMTMFFTSVGFSASFGLLKKGGTKVFLFLGAAIGLVVLQNILGISLAKLLNLDPLLGLATGSIPMTGGHGTAGAFGPFIEESGVAGATSIAIAAATFGLVAGSMIGGPTGKRLIEKHSLSKPTNKEKDTHRTTNEVIVKDQTKLLIPKKIYSATFLILIAMGLGTIVSSLLQKTGAIFPVYIGAMLVGAIIRNISESTKLFDTPMTEIDVVGGISLSLFLSMALMTLKLWELADLAIPFLIIVVAQVILVYIFANYITFNIMGRDYDAAVLSAGHCGFGLGATANGIAVMDSVTLSYGPSPASFFILPLIGSLFIDFVNSGIITTFLNILG